MRKKIFIGVPILLIIGFCAFAYLYQLDCNSCSGNGKIVTSKTCSNCKGKGTVDCNYSFKQTKEEGGMGDFFFGTTHTVTYKIRCVGGRYSTKYSTNDYYNDICSNCNGDGRADCETCDGYGSISSSRRCYKCDSEGARTLFESWFD